MIEQDTNLTIGERAVKVVKERAKQKGIPLRQELLNFGLQNYRVFLHWDVKGANPSAYYLQQLALAGYDVFYILTGKEVANNGSCDGA